jgi:ACT domain-containing protein
MEHRDAEMSDITIVLKAEFAERMQEVIKQLNEAGVGITNVNEDVGAVEGSVETNRVHLIERMECVDAVRTTFSYIADYPPGDPRDQDGPDADDN